MLNEIYVERETYSNIDFAFSNVKELGKYGLIWAIQSNKNSTQRGKIYFDCWNAIIELSVKKILLLNRMKNYAKLNKETITKNYM